MTILHMNAQVFWQRGGHFLLKSTTGKITGSYKGIQQIVGVGDLMQDDDAAVLFNSGGWLRRFANVEEFARAGQADYWRDQVILLHATRSNIYCSEDCEAGIMKIASLYVNWSTDWTGSYDAIYQYAAQWRGPYRGQMRILPYGGNRRFFQDDRGRWYYAYFPNSNDYATGAQNFCRMNL